MKLKHACADAGQYGVNVSPDAYRSDGVRMIRTSDLANGRLASPDNGVYLDGPVPDMQVLRAGDILLSRAGTIGRSYLVPDTASGMTFAGFLVRFRPLPAVDSRYLSYAIQSSRVQQQIEAQAVTSTISNFNADRYSNLELPDLGVEEQRRIADILDDRVSRIDRIISARREQVELAAARQQAQLSQIMDRQAERSGLAPLRRFCAGIEQGSSPVAEERPAGPGESGVLKTSSVFRGAFFPERYKTFDASDADDRYLVRSGDVIVIRGSGSAELVGDAAAAHSIPEGPPLYLSDLTYRLRGLNVVPQYAVLALISSRGRSELGSLVRQGSGPAKARGDDIMSISMPIATVNEQRQCVEAEAKVRDQSNAAISDLNRSMHLLTEYKSSLITAAVTGEFDMSTAGSSIPG